MNALVFPPRKGHQTLHGYVRDNFRQVERELAVGVPYRTLIEAVLAAGFVSVARRSIETAVYLARKRGSRLAGGRASYGSDVAPLSPGARMDPVRSQAKEDRSAIGRRFRELARPPKFGAGEADELI